MLGGRASKQTLLSDHEMEMGGGVGVHFKIRGSVRDFTCDNEEVRSSLPTTLPLFAIPFIIVFSTHPARPVGEFEAILTTFAGA
jgi:hypothetical protein